LLCGSEETAVVLIGNTLVGLLGSPIRRRNDALKMLLIIRHIEPVARACKALCWQEARTNHFPRVRA
jgi:hypothetical protein